MDNAYNTQRYSDAFVPSFRLPNVVEERFALDRRRLLQEPERVEPTIRNVVIPRAGVKREEEDFCELAAPLRISVEIYPSGEHIAHLVAEDSIVGFGDNIEEAVNNTMMMLFDDLSFYVEADDDDLTLDAIELKSNILKLFRILDGSR